MASDSELKKKHRQTRLLGLKEPLSQLGFEQHRGTFYRYAGALGWVLHTRLPRSYPSQTGWQVWLGLWLPGGVSFDFRPECFRRLHKPKYVHADIGAPSFLPSRVAVEGSAGSEADPIGVQRLRELLECEWLPWFRHFTSLDALADVLKTPTEVESLLDHPYGAARRTLLLAKVRWLQGRPMEALATLDQAETAVEDVEDLHLVRLWAAQARAAVTEMPVPPRLVSGGLHLF